MHRAEDRPPNTHCRVCGAELKVEHLRRTRVRGLFGPRQWQASFVCPQCGERSGSGWSMLKAVHTPSNPLLRLLYTILGKLRPRPTMPQNQRPFVDANGRLSLAKLVEAAPFPVFGLKGMPLGLRLRSPGWGGGGTHGIGETHFGYVRGAFFEPDAALELVQGSGLRNPGEEHSQLSIIESLLRKYGQQAQHAAWIERAERRTITIKGGLDAKEGRRIRIVSKR